MELCFYDLPVSLGEICEPLFWSWQQEQRPAVTLRATPCFIIRVVDQRGRFWSSSFVSLAWCEVRGDPYYSWLATLVLELNLMGEGWVEGASHTHVSLSSVTRSWGEG